MKAVREGHSISIFCLIITWGAFVILLSLSGSCDASNTGVLTLDNHRDVGPIYMDLNNVEYTDLGTFEYTVGSTPVEVDIDGDGIKEIYFTTSDGKVIRKSAMKDEYEVIFQDSDGQFQFSPQFIDIDFDGHMDMIIHDSENESIRCFNMTNQVEIWNSRSFIHNEINPQPKVSIESHKKTSMVIISVKPNLIYFVDSNGNVLKQLAIEEMGDNTQSFPQIAVDDLDLDGTEECIAVGVKKLVGFETLCVAIINLENLSVEISASFIPISSSLIWSITPPVVHDVFPEDYGQEIIVGSQQAGIWAISSTIENIIWTHHVGEEKRWNSIDVVS